MRPNWQTRVFKAPKLMQSLVMPGCYFRYHTQPLFKSVSNQCRGKLSENTSDYFSRIRHSEIYCKRTVNQCIIPHSLCNARDETKSCVPVQRNFSLSSKPTAWILLRRGALSLKGENDSVCLISPLTPAGSIYSISC
jgi:hypothetical protein